MNHVARSGRFDSDTLKLRNFSNLVLEKEEPNIINRLSTEVLFIRVINYFGGSFQSKVLYKFGFFEGILRDF